MFDWFRAVGEELGGIDSTAAKKERLEKRERKKLNRFIFSNTTKVIFIVCGTLYLITAGSMIFALKGKEEAVSYIVKYIFMSTVDIVVLFALIFGKKKGEIVALIGTFVFVVGLFLSTVLL